MKAQLSHFMYLFFLEKKRKKKIEITTTRGERQQTETSRKKQNDYLPVRSAGSEREEHESLGEEVPVADLFLLLAGSWLPLVLLLVLLWRAVCGLVLQRRQACYCCWCYPLSLIISPGNSVYATTNPV